jgi:uncharacterized membrane protein YgcG
MPNIEEQEIRDLLLEWNRITFDVKSQQNQANEYQKGYAEGLRFAAKGLRSLLKKHQEQAEADQTQKALQIAARAAQAEVYKNIFKVIVIPLVILLLSVGAFDERGFIIPVYLVVALVYLAITRWKIKKAVFLPTAFIMFGIVFLIYGKWGQNLLASLSEATGNVGGEIMGAGLVAILVFLVGKKADLLEWGLTVLSILLGLGLVALLNMDGTNTSFLAITQQISGGLGIEMLGAGVTIILIGELAEG